MSDPTPRLLLIDDDTNNLAAVARRLTQQGYAVETSSDGAQALERLTREQFDLILLDQMMPGMGGLDVLRAIRRTHSLSELPVIMITGVDKDECVVDALREGANDYVVKPVNALVVAARIQSQLQRLRAYHAAKAVDPLTGLNNREELLTRLRAVHREVHREGTHLSAVILLDLYGFKALNNSLGSPTGNRVLTEIAQRVRAVAAEHCHSPNNYVLARTGNDEFGMFLVRPGRADLPQDVATAILSKLSLPIMIEGNEIRIEGSIGIALFDNDLQTAEDALGNALLASHHARTLGPNRSATFTSALKEQAQLQMSVAAELRHAIKRNELLPVYQPERNLATGEIVGFECLLRWRHPVRGLIPPSDFIPRAEETGQINAIGLWILDTACRQLRQWQREYPRKILLTMNVNVSVRQLSDPDFLPHVRDLLRETAVPTGTLRLEITESVLMAEIASAREKLEALRALGVGLKLDDFGTGYSSLNYLRTLPFDSLKIDRSFIKNIATDAEARQILEMIVHLAHALRMTVVAEGIEDEDQLTAVTCIGCDTGQGLYLGRPLESSEVDSLLRQPVPSRKALAATARGRRGAAPRSTRT